MSVGNLPSDDLKTSFKSRARCVSVMMLEGLVSDLLIFQTVKFLVCFFDSFVSFGCKMVGIVLIVLWAYRWPKVSLYITFANLPFSAP